VRLLKYRPIPVADAKFIRWVGFHEPIHSGISLIPDGYAEAATPEKALVMFLEVDLGHESRTVWQKKIQAYVRYAVSGTLVRKGIGRITLLDDDIVEPSNLNRQRIMQKDIGENKAIALALNLLSECIVATEIRACPFRLEEMLSDQCVACDVAICGVDNNPARVVASWSFRQRQTPEIFTAVSRDADHGYVFVQDKDGPCIACMFPDMVKDDRYPCPGTPAIADILQAVGALAVYAVDSILMKRPRAWSYRRFSLSDSSLDGGSVSHWRKGSKSPSR
jgi:molybdopterin/thiamine biosynthesis adenylyltransferase